MFPICSTNGSCFFVFIYLSINVPLSYLCRNLSFISRDFPVVFCVPCSGWWEQSVFQFCFHIDWCASLMPHIEPLSITLLQNRKRKKKSLMSAWSFPHGWKLSVTHFAQYCKKYTFWGLLMDFLEQNLDYFSLFSHEVYTGANTPSTETLRVKREQKEHKRFGRTICDL